MEEEVKRDRDEKSDVNRRFAVREVKGEGGQEKQLKEWLKQKEICEEVKELRGEGGEIVEDEEEQRRERSREGRGGTGGGAAEGVGVFVRLILSY